MSMKSDVLMQKFRDSVYEHISNPGAPRLAPEKEIERRSKLFQDWVDAAQEANEPSELTPNLIRHWAVADILALRHSGTSRYVSPSSEILRHILRNLFANRLYAEIFNKSAPQLADKVKEIANDDPLFFKKNEDLSLANKTVLMNEGSTPAEISTGTNDSNGFVGHLVPDERSTPNDNEPEAVRKKSAQVDSAEFISAVLESVSYRPMKDGSVLYQVGDLDAFFDHGDRLVMAPKAKDDEAAILAAILQAKEKFAGSFELTGTDEFKRRSMEIMLKHGINVNLKNPAQEALFREISNTVPVSQHGQGKKNDSDVAGSGSAPVEAREAEQESNGVETTDEADEEHEEIPAEYANGEPIASILDAEALLGEGTHRIYFFHEQADPYEPGSGLEIKTIHDLDGVTADQLLAVPLPDQPGPSAADLFPVRAIDWWDVQRQAIHYWAKTDAELKADLDQLGSQPGVGEVYWFTKSGQPTSTPHDAESYLKKLSMVDNESLAGFVSGTDQALRVSDAVSNGNNAQLVPTTQPKEFVMSQSNDDKPEVALRGVKRLGNGDYDTTVLLFKGRGEYLQGFVKVGDEKRHVIAHLNERKADVETGEVKPNFITLSESDGNGDDAKWTQIGHGNALNQRKDGKPVYFDEVLFNVSGEVLKARITSHVDAALHRQLGFQEPRQARPKSSSDDASPKQEASAAKAEAADAPQPEKAKRSPRPAAV